jgi:uncharacterized protein YcfJ
MKKLTLVFGGMACALGGVSVAQAQEQGRVISSTPVIQQVAVPRQVCTQEQVTSQSQQKSGGGALFGALVGGVLGNMAGKGSGRVAATGVGMVAGAVIGDRAEGGQAVASTSHVQRCSTQNFYENRTTAYNVVYEFNGKQYQVQMPQDPGPYVSLQITPVSAPVSPSSTPAEPIAPVAPVIVRPVTQAPVFIEPPVISSYSYVQPVVVAPPAPVWVRPAPVYVAPVVVPRVVYRHPHPHGHPYHQRGGAVVNIGYHGHWR